MKDYIQQIIKIFANSNQDDKVTKEVQQWLLSPNHDEEKNTALNSLWDDTEGRVNADTWRSLNAVREKIGVSKQVRSHRHYMRFWRYAAAAVVIIAISISGTYYITSEMYSEPAMVEKFTLGGNMSFIELPDGSKVQTNSSTLLLYPEAFKGDTRTVYLIGEANFKVKKNPDKPFIVKSAMMSVTALGTEFNVAAYPESNDIVATLIQGKIKVDCKGEKESYILTPGQQVTYQKNAKKSILEDANLNDVTAWQRGQFVFRGVTMKEILSTLERRYNITFQCNMSQFNDDKYNFRFREKSSIESIMGILKEVVGGFDYKIEGDICYVKNK